MFTGIVQGMGRVAAFTTNDFGVRLVIDAQEWAHRPKTGDSIAISGVCLTHTPRGGEGDGGDRMLRFDVIRETLDKTTLGSLKVDDAVNLEPPLTAGAELGGHFVQGHVDGVGQITGVKRGAEEWRVTIAPPEALMPYIVSKGSVAVDGVSLTIAAVGEGGGDDFTVALIPTTLRLTTLGAAMVGGRVNLEADMFAKTIVNYLKNYTGAGAAAGAKNEQGVTLETLRAAGFAE